MSGRAVLEVAQWQGSGAATAGRLRSGAARLAELMPEGRRCTVALDGGVESAHGGVRNAPEPGGLGIDDLLAAVRALTREFTLAGIALTEYERGEDAGQEEAALRRIVDGLFGTARG
ncbi:hypothetical protein ABZ281_30770 [Streptomyces sp. NPDC006265]|uniref:hypothetical protein n=1 Tax=Streptomyces sp. NPDC006265 TaxID=3156740 RepID=UPI0033AEC4BA